jgi:predicted hydrocarbon binding protein
MAVHVKGLVLKSFLDYVLESQGKAGQARLLEALSPEVRAMVSGDVLFSSWYPLRAAIEGFVAVDRLFGKGDLDLCREIGRYTARAALKSGVQQSFAREFDPEFAIKMGPVIWPQYYDSGRVEVESISPTTAITRIVDFAEPNRAICVSVQGWTEEATRIWGGVQVKLRETRCVAQGDPLCEFILKWKDPRAVRGS